MVYSASDSCEPMEETVYLDQVRLLAIDHPAEFEVYPTSDSSAHPFPEFRVIASRDGPPARRRLGDQGNDVLGLSPKRS